MNGPSAPSALEQAILSQDGAAVVPGLLSSDVVVPSGAPVGDRFEGFQPVLFEHGTPMLAVFTSLERARVTADLAPYVVTLTGRQLLAMMPAGNGIVVNPGHADGVELSAATVERVRAELAS